MNSRQYFDHSMLCEKLLTFIHIKTYNQRSIFAVLLVSGIASEEKIEQTHNYYIHAQKLYDSFFFGRQVNHYDPLRLMRSITQSFTNRKTEQDQH